MMLNIDNQLSKENDCIENIIKEEKLIEGTTFISKDNIYNCFNKLILKNYNSKNDLEKEEIIIDKINKRIIKEDILNKSKRFKNRNNKQDIVALDIIECKIKNKKYFSESRKLWFEEIEQEIIDRGDFYTNVIYVFLIVKELNAVKQEPYEFLGLYKLIDYDRKNNLRLWEKQNFQNNIVPLNDDEIIEVIKNIENGRIIK